MDAEASCILCNWANNVLWPYFGLGALGAAAAAAAAGGFFGGGGYSSGGADDAGADDSNPDPPPQQYDYPRVPPQYDDYVNHPDRYRNTDSDGNPYWPGISPIPSDGVAYTRDLIKFNWGDPATHGPHPVDPNTGRLVLPEADLTPGGHPPAGWAGAARG